MSSEKRFSGDDDFRVMKLSYIKKQADAALKAGNAKDAYTKYTECLPLVPPGYGETHTIYSNRSLAYAKANKFDDALRDAEQACKLKADWDKAWWRKATALRGLKRYNEALQAYRGSFERTNRQDCEVAKEYKLAIRDVTRSMTREQLADFIVSTLDEYENRGIISLPREQSVTKIEKREAMFQHIKSWQTGNKRMDNDYANSVAMWTLTPMSTAMAYLQRACMYVKAHCFKQVIFDTKAALRRDDIDPKEAMKKTVLVKPGTTNPYEERLFFIRPWAWFLQGDGFRADEKHALRNDVKAALCYHIAARKDDENNTNKEYMEAYDAICSNLNNKQTSEVLNEANEQHMLTSLGFISDEIGNNIYRVMGAIVISCVFPSKFNSNSRVALKAKIAELTGVVAKDVLIERVSKIIDGKLKIEYQFTVDREETGQACVDILKSFSDNSDDRILPGQLLSHEPYFESLNVSDHELLPIEERILAATDDSSALVEGDRPALAMDLPYRTYTLTRSNGEPVERVDKHAFCMARVFYDRNEVDYDVWYSPSDGRCRWRQSASEISVMVLGIPRGTAASELDVNISPTSIRVSELFSGRVFIEGELQERIVPDDSAWDISEDGIVTLYLYKANLALFASPHQHNATEWKKLFTSDGYEIKFDDACKDYSDLPAPVMAQFRKSSAIDGVRRRLEAKESKARDRVSELDDLRRRKRQTRLAALRGQPIQSWVKLDREGIPSKPAM